jgi:hypothetical protein
VVHASLWDSSKRTRARFGDIEFVISPFKS